MVYMKDIFVDIRNESSAYIRQFIEENVRDANYKNDLNQSVLHFAAEYPENVEVVKVLISMGANVNPKDDLGMTPLHIAALYGSVEIAKILVSNGANINAEDVNGFTPLHSAAVGAALAGTAVQKNIEIAQFLVSQGADCKAKSKNESYTPLEMAKNNNIMPMVQYLSGIDTAKEKAERERVANERAEKERAERKKAEKEKAKIEEIKQKHEQMISSDPNNAEAYITRGYAFFAHGMADGGNQVFFDHAIEDFTEAIKLDPNAIDAYTSRAGAYFQENDLDRAIADYDRAIQINPNNAEAYAFRGEVYSQTGKQDQALADFNEAIRLDPKCKNAYTFRGALYFGKGVQNKENADYDKAIEDIGKVIADIEEALRLEPEDTAATDFLKKVKNEKEVVERMRREQQAQYDRLVQEMGKATTEEKYQDLARQLRRMRGYKDTAELANKCDNRYQELRKERERREEEERKERERREAEERERERIKTEKVKRKQTIGIALQFGMLIAFLYVLWGTNLIYSIKESVMWNILLPAVLSLALGIISWLFRKGSILPWGTVFLVFGLAATTVTANVWLGGSIAGGIISVILALIPTGIVYYIWGFSCGDIGENIGYTVLTIVVTAIVYGIITGISGNSSIFTFIFLVIPAIPGMIVMHKTELNTN